MNLIDAPTPRLNPGYINTIQWNQQNSGKEGLHFIHNNMCICVIFRLKINFLSKMCLYKRFMLSELFEIITKSSCRLQISQFHWSNQLYSIKTTVTDCTRMRNEKLSTCPSLN